METCLVGGPETMVRLDNAWRIAGVKNLVARWAIIFDLFTVKRKLQTQKSDEKMSKNKCFLTGLNICISFFCPSYY